MASSTTQTQILVRISADKSEARLIVPGDFDRAQLSAPACRGILEDAGISYTSQVEQAVEKLCSGPPPAGEDADVLIAQAAPVRHGEDGKVQWAVDRHASADDGKEHSYYDQSAFVMVKQGQVVGTIIAPVPGEDGCDVTGKVIAARQGKEANIKLDESLMRSAKGEMIAQLDGVLVRSNGKAAIKKLLEVPEDVDFKTGNIDFDGDLTIRGRVCDRFVVHATGHIEVGKLIEAATIHSGGDLIARGGIAGREIGKITVGGDLTTRYLDSATVMVRGSLHLEREAINTTLTVSGQLLGEHATIIGGQTTALGPAHIGTLGSDAAVQTILIGGRAPQLEQQAAGLRELIRQFTKRQEALTHEQAQFSKRASSNSATQKERQTEIMFELQGIQSSLNKAAAGLAMLEQQIQARRAVDITIHRKLHRGSVLAIRQVRFKTVDDMTGPIHITADAEHHPRLIRAHGDPQPLAQCPALRSMGEGRD